MGKKLVVAIVSGAFILGAGTMTFAQSNGEGERLLNFGQMKPYIEQMHPELTTQEQKEMFDACHGEGGMMENMTPKAARTMMNNF